jgi:hypothetical protein
MRGYTCDCTSNSVNLPGHNSRLLHKPEPVVHSESVPGGFCGIACTEGFHAFPKTVFPSKGKGENSLLLLSRPKNVQGACRGHNCHTGHKGVTVRWHDFHGATLDVVLIRRLGGFLRKSPSHGARSLSPQARQRGGTGRSAESRHHRGGNCNPAKP